VPARGRSGASATATSVASLGLCILLLSTIHFEQLKQLFLYCPHIVPAPGL